MLFLESFLAFYGTTLGSGGVLFKPCHTKYQLPKASAIIGAKYLLFGLQVYLFIIFFEKTRNLFKNKVMVKSLKIFCFLFN